MRTLKYHTSEECQAAIEQFNALLGFPEEKSDTLTYAEVPEANEDGEFELIITSELEMILYPETETIKGQL